MRLGWPIKLAHSVGREFGYTRRPGAPMPNVASGGTVFFVTRGEIVKHAAFWGSFTADVETQPQAACAEFGHSLSAPTYDSWIEDSLALIDELTPTTPIRVLQFSKLTVPRIPIPIGPLG